MVKKAVAMPERTWLGACCAQKSSHIYRFYLGEILIQKRRIGTCVCGKRTRMNVIVWSTFRRAGGPRTSLQPDNRRPMLYDTLPAAKNQHILHSN